MKHFMYRIDMNTNAIPFKLKKPTVVFAIATAFLVAPFANLAVPLMIGGHRSWYSPMIWATLFVKLPVIEQALLIATLVSGILLFFQRKTSWFAAVIILLLVSIYQLLVSFGSEPLSKLGPLNLVINGGIFVVFYFFRFPYLDQRDHIMKGISKRYNVKIPAKVNDTFDCEIRNLSESGCFVTFNDFKKFQPGDSINLRITAHPELNVQVVVGHLTHGLGLKFEKLDGLKIKLIRKLLDSAN